MGVMVGDGNQDTARRLGGWWKEKSDGGSSDKGVKLRFATELGSYRVMAGSYGDRLNIIATGRYRHQWTLVEAVILPSARPLSSMLPIQCSRLVYIVIYTLFKSKYIRL